jgi:hypothetical protein
MQRTRDLACGNLIALPLQKQPRGSGRSVFVDENLTPYPDQWAFLAAIHSRERFCSRARTEAPMFLISLGIGGQRLKIRPHGSLYCAAKPTGGHAMTDSRT